MSAGLGCAIYKVCYICIPLSRSTCIYPDTSTCPPIYARYIDIQSFKQQQLFTFLSKNVDTIWRSCCHGRYPGREDGELELGSVLVVLEGSPLPPVPELISWSRPVLLLWRRVLVCWVSATATLRCVAKWDVDACAYNASKIWAEPGVYYLCRVSWVAGPVGSLGQFSTSYSQLVATARIGLLELKWLQKVFSSDVSCSCAGLQWQATHFTLPASWPGTLLVSVASLYIATHLAELTVKWLRV